MSTPATPMLDFSRVRYEGDPETPDACKYCGRGIQGEYYRIANETGCATCAENVRTQLPADTHKAFMHSLLWGIPAAVLGMALYAGFEIVTGISIGYLAVGVGYLVAKAMLRGSGGVRGRRYQWTALLLTYAAVAMAFIPMTLVASARNQHNKKPAVTAQTTTSQSAPAAAAARQPKGAATENAFPSADYDKVPLASATQKPGRFGTYAPRQDNTQAKSEPAQPRHGFLYAAGLLLGFGLISPFYELTVSFGGGALGLLILFWGMRAAWQLMAAPTVAVDGPFGAVDAA